MGHASAAGQPTSWGVRVRVMSTLFFRSPGRSAMRSRTSHGILKLQGAVWRGGKGLSPAGAWQISK